MSTDPIVIAIPSRYGASRLPGKPLREIAGKTLIAHVIDRALSFAEGEIVVATDDKRIAQIAQDRGVRALMTRADHATGSDRLAEVARQLKWSDATIVVNLQGDEPLMPISCLRAVILALQHDTGAAAATLSTPIEHIEEIFDPNCVKLVTDQRNRALYFSRAPIPWARDAWAKNRGEMPGGATAYRHIGVYAYRAATLRRFAQLAQSPLEKLESLEQLRLLENGLAIAVALAPEPIPAGIDTEEDLQRVSRILNHGAGPLAAVANVRSVIFVCMGNICRSPLAEAVARMAFASVGLDIRVASAGTIGFHEGDPADAGAFDIADLHQIDLRAHRARKVRQADFLDFDLILALDERNHADLLRASPINTHQKICRLLDFAPDTGHREIPDPYELGRTAFGESLALIKVGVAGLTAHLLEARAAHARGERRE